VTEGENAKQNGGDFRKTEGVPDARTELFDVTEFRNLQESRTIRDHHLWRSPLVIECLLELYRAPSETKQMLSGALKKLRNKATGAANHPDLLERCRRAIVAWCSLKDCRKLDRENAAAEGLRVLEKSYSENSSTARSATEGCDFASSKLLEFHRRAGMMWPAFCAYLETARIHDRKATHALDLLILKHMGLSSTLAYEINVGNEPIEDKRQNGVLGLRRAILNFDPDFGSSFSSFAVPIIKSFILRAAQTEGRTVRLPSHVHEKLSIIRKFEEGFEKKHLQTPSPDQIAEDTGFDILLVRVLLGYRQPLVELDAPIGGEYGVTRLDLMSEAHFVAPNFGAEIDSPFEGGTTGEREYGEEAA
jgi:DNA-directed RNA polymerase sigma subunit (sigma70/sigma32)